MREYVIYSIQSDIPVGLLPDGIRRFIENELRGRPVGGTIQRNASVKFGQHVVVNFVGTTDDLDSVKNALESIYWRIELVYSEPRMKVESQIEIRASTNREVKSGPGSDSKFEPRSPSVRNLEREEGASTNILFSVSRNFSFINICTFYSIITVQCVSDGRTSE
jgi:hypothetical protein